MIMTYRSLSVASGKFPSAMKFAHEISAYIKQNTGVELRVAVPIGGNPFRIGYSGQHENLAAYEAFIMKLTSDAKFLEMQVKNSDNFIAGSARDEIWRTV